MPDAMADSDARHAHLLQQVLHLHLVEGLSARGIARRLSVSRNTVRRLLGRAPERARSAGEVARQSILLPYMGAISEMLSATPELRAPAVLERLRPLGYRGGITTVRDHLRRTRPQPRREAFLSLDFPPGAAMQVDWADFGFALPGCARRLSAFVAVLCYSRQLYLEFTLSQRFGTFVRAMDRALSFFGGTTAVDIFDNMKTVVRSGSGKTAVFNPSFLAYARARGFAVSACNVRAGYEKGRVERPIGFIRERFWPGRRPKDLLDINQQAAAWRDSFANGRVHETTGKVPALVFKHEEQALLKPLAETTFDTDDVETTGVNKRFRVRFDRNTYSVPPRLVHQTVVVRANDDAVAIYLGPKQVALHRRSWLVGEDKEEASHRQAALQQKPRARTGALPPQLTPLGDTGVEYFRVFCNTTRSIQREVTRITFLLELFGQSATTDAIDEVMRTGHVGAEYVEYVLRHKRRLTPAPKPLYLGNPELDALNFDDPDLAVYDRIVPPQKTLDPGEPTDKDTQDKHHG